jgi:hypothetical protein
VRHARSEQAAQAAGGPRAGDDEVVAAGGREAGQRLGRVAAQQHRGERDVGGHLVARLAEQPQHLALGLAAQHVRRVGDGERAEAGVQARLGDDGGDRQQRALGDGDLDRAPDRGPAAVGAVEGHEDAAHGVRVRRERRGVPIDSFQQHGHHLPRTTCHVQFVAKIVSSQDGLGGVPFAR